MGASRFFNNFGNSKEKLKFNQIVSLRTLRMCIPHFIVYCIYKSNKVKGELFYLDVVWTFT